MVRKRSLAVGAVREGCMGARTSCAMPPAAPTVRGCFIDAVILTPPTEFMVRGRRSPGDSAVKTPAASEPRAISRLTD